MDTVFCSTYNEKTVFDTSKTSMEQSFASVFCVRKRKRERERERERKRAFISSVPNRAREAVNLVDQPPRFFFVATVLNP